jgi:DNA repair protein RadC
VSISTYVVEKDAERHPFLVEEQKIEYGVSCIQSPKDVVDLINHAFRLRFMAEEYVYLLSLDSQGHILGMFEVSHGTVNSSHCNPREIFLRSLVSGGNSAIIVHNHPSGDTSPSDTDIYVSKRLYDAGKLIGINVDDFIIVGEEDEYYSFNEEGMISQYGREDSNEQTQSL